MEPYLPVNNTDEDDYSMLNKPIYCHRCKCKSFVTKIHAANMSRPDPTEAYTLKCGHTVI